MAVVRKLIIVGSRWVCVLPDSTAMDLICALLVVCPTLLSRIVQEWFYSIEVHSWKLFHTVNAGLFAVRNDWCKF